MRNMSHGQADPRRSGHFGSVHQNEALYHYTIWHTGNEVFGYYECEKGVEYAAKVQRESPIVEKWNEYMKDVLIMEPDPVTSAQPKLTKVFSFK